MKHTTIYRISVNHRDRIVLLDKPLEDAPFFKNPRGYCQEDNARIKALIHRDNIRDELFFRNYKDTDRYYNYLKATLPKDFDFFNVFAWQPTTTII